MSTKKADRKLPASKTSQSNSGMRNLYRRSNASFVFAATPRPQNTLRTNFYSVMLSFDRFTLNRKNALLCLQVTEIRPIASRAKEH